VRNKPALSRIDMTEEIAGLDHRRGDRDAQHPTASDNISVEIEG
jgi:hypothetical protein